MSVPASPRLELLSPGAFQSLSAGLALAEFGTGAGEFPFQALELAERAASLSAEDPLILTVLGDRQSVLLAIHAGADGYLLKRTPAARKMGAQMSTGIHQSTDWIAGEQYAIEAENQWIVRLLTDSASSRRKS